MGRKWGSQTYGRDVESREHICVLVKRIEQAERIDEASDGWRILRVISLGERREMPECLHDYSRVSKKKRADSKGESRIAVVQIRRQLKRSNTHILKKPVTVTQRQQGLWSLGHWMKLSLLKETKAGNMLTPV